jgi:Protein of unknown function (DUF2917)
MHTDLIRAARSLAKGQLFRIDDGQGQRVECLRGALWLTQHNDRRDVILHPGEGFTIERRGATFVSALGDSAYAVLDAIPPVDAAAAAHAARRESTGAA